MTPEERARCIALLVEHAFEGRLGVFVGAGVSAAPPSLIPLSEQLVRLLAPEIRAEINIEALDASGKPRGLEDIGDEAESNGTIGTLRRIAARNDAFNVEPNNGHEVLAILMREGLAEVLGINWDRCIELAAAGLSIDVSPTIWDRDRAGTISVAKYHKLHGCRSVPESLRISTRDISEPLPWAADEARSAVGGGAMVFVGIGTIPPYVAARLTQLLDLVEDLAAVYVVSRKPSLQWARLLRGKYRSGLVQASSDVFLAEFMTACVTRVLARCEAQVETWISDRALDEEARSAMRTIAAALANADPISAWAWLARSGASIPVGLPVMTSGECRDAVIALAKSAGGTQFSVEGARESTTLRYERGYVELALAPRLAADRLVDRESRRLERRRASGHFRSPDMPVVHVCAGHRGELPTRGVKRDLIATGDPTDVAVGPQSGEQYWIPAETALQGGGFDLP